MNVLTRRFSLFVLVALLGACRSAPSAEAPAAAEEEAPSLAVTIWSERSELFMEYPPLVAGEDARFAIHLTDLSNFQPLREGKVVVRFEGDTIQRFEVDGPSTPGIFGVDVKVPAARRYQMTVEVHHPRFRDEHPVGPATVYTDTASALAAVRTDEE
jgi:hypothetical protein